MCGLSHMMMLTTFKHQLKTFLFNSA